MKRLGRQTGAKAANQRLQLAVKLMVGVVQPLQPLDSVFCVQRQLVHVHMQQLAARHHHAPTHHHRLHRAAVFGVHQRVGDVVKRNHVDMAAVKKHDVGLETRRNAAQLVTKTKRPGAADGGCVQHLVGGDPVLPVGALHFRDQRRQAHRFKHVLVVRAVRTVGTQPHVNAAGQHLAHVSQTAAQAHVAAGVVRDGGTLCPQPLHVVIVQPHAVRHREVWPDDAEFVHVRGQRGAVSAHAGNHLHL